MKPADVTITLDGKSVKAPAGSNLIDVAKANGVEIPHYCYHPALPVAGNCRMCFVEVEGMPHPQIACNMPVKDGLIVNTKTPKAVDARKWTLEFLLANHPLDCPICDKAGECELQNFSYKYGKTHTDFIEKKRTPETVPLSEKLWIEKDRCIVCLRCVQFLKEVGGKEELYIKQRGNASEITIAPGKPVESEYQLNTVDICPVGALSSTKFRFAERVWNLERYETICPMCPRGCNTRVEVMKNDVNRVVPRFNAEVNSYWMCDAGRDHYTLHHSGRRRLEQSLQNGAVIPRGTAVAEIAKILKQVGGDEVLVLVSNWLCNEDIAEIKTFVKRFLPKATISGPEFKDGGDKLLRRTDFGPNARGLRDTFQSAFKEAGGVKRSYPLILSFGVDPASLGLTGRCFYYGAYYDKFVDAVEVAVPGLAHGEIDGSYTNFEGVVQRFDTFLKAPKESITAEELLMQLTAILDPSDDDSADTADGRAEAR